jgi:hypothetical protein
VTFGLKKYFKVKNMPLPSSRSKNERTAFTKADIRISP